MNKRSFRIATIALSATILLFCHSRSFTRDGVTNTSDIADLAWMTGDWQTDPNGRITSDEHWSRPGGGVMIGMSRTVAGNKLVSFESLRIEQRGEAIFYVANVKGRCPATDFKLTRLNAQVAVFENPDHDFPKRIIYRKTSAKEMIASVDGGEGTKAQDFVLHFIPGN
jgi:hypothetical protein